MRFSTVNHSRNAPPTVHGSHKGGAADSFAAQASAAVLPTAVRSLEAPTHSSLASGRRPLRRCLLVASVPAVPRACVRSRSLSIARIATRSQLFTDYTLVFGLYEVAVNYAQSSIINSSMRSKCLRLDVTSVASTASAWAAMAISKSSTLAPRVSSFAFTRPKWSETSGVHIAI